MAEALQEAFLNEFELKKNELNETLLRPLKVGEFPKTKRDFYQSIYNFIQKWANKDAESETLYTYFESIITELSKEFSNQLKEKSNETIIDDFIERSIRMDNLINFLAKTFSFVDFYYVKFSKKDFLLKCAQKIYKENLFKPYQEVLTIGVNKLLKEDRDGRREYRIKIKKILEIMEAMDLENPMLIYENQKLVWRENKEIVKSTENQEKEEGIKTPIQEHWYNYFEKDTEQFVIKKAKNDIHNRSTPEYVLIELEFLEEEHNRQKELLNELFTERLNALIYKEIIGKYMVELVEMDSGVKNMLENNKYNELSDLFKLFQNYEPSLDEIAKIFKEYIEKRGISLNDDKENKDPKKFIPELIKLKKEIDKLVKDCFENHNKFQDTNNKAFSSFMKKDYYAKQLSNYLDYCMRIGFKGKSEEEIENTLNDIIILFKCLMSKLVFQNEVNKKMSDRLIKKVSQSITNEKLFITKLNQEAGVSYTSKMQAMITDLEKNKTDIENYKLSEHKGSPNGIKLDITVISQSAWEISKKSMEKIETPEFMTFCLNDFETFYKNKHPGLKLTWCFGLSKLTIEYLYLKQKIYSVSTLPQILSLLILEKKEKLSIKQIAELCGCQSSTIIEDIHGLVYNPSFNSQGQHDKGIIIGTFNSEKKEFKETDEISINKNFSCSRVKINTLPLPQKKTADEIKAAENEESIIMKKYEDNIIQATVTRIMKSKIGQQTTHVWLVNETAKQIDLFRAQPSQIKENIEKLIEKNVVKRNDNDRTCYDYVA